MDDQDRTPTDPTSPQHAETSQAPTDTRGPAPDRTDRDPDEGPARDGGSALTADEEAADEEVGGGD